MDISPLSFLDIKLSTTTLTSDYDIHKAPGNKEFSDTLQLAKEQQKRAQTSFDQPKKTPEVERNDRLDTVKQAQRQEQASKEVKRDDDNESSVRNGAQSSESSSVRVDKKEADKSDASMADDAESKTDENDIEESGKLLPQVISQDGKTLQVEEDKESSGLVFVSTPIVRPSVTVSSELSESNSTEENAVVNSLSAENAAVEYAADFSLSNEQATVESKKIILDESPEEKDDITEEVENNKKILELSASGGDKVFDRSIKDDVDASENNQLVKDQDANSENPQLVLNQQNAVLETDGNIQDKKISISSDKLTDDNNDFVLSDSVISPSDPLSDKKQNDKHIKTPEAHANIDDNKNNVQIGLVAQNKNNDKSLGLNDASVVLDKKLDQISNSTEKNLTEQASTNVSKNSALKTTSEFSRLLSGVKQPIRETIELPVGHKNWGEMLAEKTMLLVSQKGNSARLNLIPHNLGPLEIKLQLQGDASSIEFVAHHAHTKDAIETAIPKLREMFESGGLSLGDVNVRDQSKNSRGHEPHQFLARKENEGQMVSLPAELSSDAGKSIRNGLVDYIV